MVFLSQHFSLFEIGVSLLAMISESQPLTEENEREGEREQRTGVIHPKYLTP